jgi:fibronectin type 3 domain-containing protein
MKNEVVTGDYSPEYLEAVNKIANDEAALQKALADLKDTGYVNSKEDFIKAATDKKIGAVHQYITSINKPEPITTPETMGDYPDPSRNYNLTKVSSKVV